MVKAKLAVRTVIKEEPVCGFCNTGDHQHCPSATRGMGPKMGAKVWLCGCPFANCGGKIVRCLECKNEAEGDIDPALRMCLDQLGCQARVTARLDSNPHVQDTQRFKETAMARVAATKTAAAATPRVAKEKKSGVCLVTGEATSGGLFKPGMDARYVSERVAEVINKEVTVVEQRKRIKADGVSEALQAKFEKNLGLAKDRVTKAKEEAKAAPAKKTAAPVAKKAAPAAPKETAAQRRKRLAAEEAAAAETEDEEVEDEDEDEEEDGDDF